MTSPTRRLINTPDFKRGEDAAENQSAAPHSDTDDDADILDKAIAWLDKTAIVNRDYDIPYLAGTSENVSTVYIDRSMPLALTVKGKRVVLEPYLVCHELVERAIMDDTGMPYQLAHQLSQRLERALVSDSGIDYEEYDRLMHELEEQCYAKVAGKTLHLPTDLDIKPYVDEKDKDVLELMNGHRRDS